MNLPCKLAWCGVFLCIVMDLVEGNLVEGNLPECAKGETIPPYVTRMTCSGCGCNSIEPTYENSGNITDGPGNYNNEETCIWNIQSSSNIKFEFEYINLELNFDYLRIYGCKSFSSCQTPPYIEWTGNVITTQLTHEITVPANQALLFLHVQFASDKSKNFNGFSGTWATTPDWDGSCEQCAAGKYKDSVGTSPCVSCAANMVPNPESTSCVCNAGFIGPDNGACEPCPANTYKATALSYDTNYARACGDGSQACATAQIDTTHGAVSSRANDGNTATNWADMSCTHTEEKSGLKWWKVDLDNQVTVNSLSLYGRSGYGHNKGTEGFSIYIGNDDSCAAGHKNDICVQDQPYLPSDGSLKSVTCTPPITGKYICVVTNDQKHLTLCEVQVWSKVCTQCPAHLTSAEGSASCSCSAGEEPTHQLYHDFSECNSLESWKLYTASILATTSGLSYTEQFGVQGILRYKLPANYDMVQVIFSNPGGGTSATSVFMDDILITSTTNAAQAIFTEEYLVGSIIEIRTSGSSFIGSDLSIRVYQQINNCSTCMAGKSKSQIGDTHCLCDAAGTESVIAGNPSDHRSNACVACVPGKYNTVAGNPCEDCPAGKYSRGMGNTACETCDAGRTSSSPGSSFCVCPPGTQGFNHGPCTSCAPGSYEVDSFSSATLVAFDSNYNEGARAHISVTFERIPANRRLALTVRVAQAVWASNISQATIVMVNGGGADWVPVPTDYTKADDSLGACRTDTEALFTIIDAQELDITRDPETDKVGVNLTGSSAVVEGSFADCGPYYLKAYVTLHVQGKCSACTANAKSSAGSVNVSVSQAQKDNSFEGYTYRDKAYYESMTGFSTNLDVPTPAACGALCTAVSDNICRTFMFRSNADNTNTPWCLWQTAVDIAPLLLSTSSVVFPVWTKTSACECLAGMGYDMQTKKCSPCEYGEYKSGVGNSECQMCSENAHSKYNKQSEECTCNAGASGSDSGVCTLCSTGKYKEAAGSEECVNCPNGKYTKGPGATGCLSCSNNSTLSLPAGKKCECNPGFSGPGGGPPCVKCAPGRYSEASGATECLPCGREAIESRQACVPCAPGTEARAISSDPYVPGPCVPCALDYYTVNSPDFVCLPCPKNMHTKSTGSVGLHLCVCNSGHGLKNGESAENGCVECVAGKRSTGGAQTPCVKCEVGTYAAYPKSSECVSCPDGFESLDDGSAFCTVKPPVPTEPTEPCETGETPSPMNKLALFVEVDIGAAPWRT